MPSIYSLTTMLALGLASVALTSCFPDTTSPKRSFTGTWSLDAALSEKAIMAGKEYKEQQGTTEQKLVYVKTMLQTRSGVGFKVTEDSFTMVNEGTGEAMMEARPLIKKSDDGNSATFGPPEVTIFFADESGKTVKCAIQEQDWIDAYVIYTRK